MAERAFEKFTYVEVADFTEEQQEYFVAKWYSHEPEKLERFQEEWSKDANTGLRELARTPLLLALMCLVFDETLSFPKRRVEIYQEALGALLKKWDSSRGIVRDDIYRKLSPVRKEQLLARIAADTFRTSSFFVPKSKLIQYVENYLAALPPADHEEVIDGEAVLLSMEAQHGILVERAYGIYAFSHLTFHEYYTAKYMIENAGAGALDDLVSQHLFNDQWREVFLLVASLLDDGEGLLQQMLSKIRWCADQEKAIARVLDYVANEAEKVLLGHKRMESRHARSRLSQGRNVGTRSRDHRFAVVLDTALAAAVELQGFGGNNKSAAAWRLRILASLIQGSPAVIYENLGRRNEPYEYFAAFMKSTLLLLECTNLAVVSDRGRYVDCVLSPLRIA